MEEQSEVIDKELHDLDDLLSNEYDDDSEEWMDQLIDSETEDDIPEEETDEKETSEKKQEENTADDPLCIDDPEINFFDMNLSPAEKPENKEPVHPPKLLSSKKNIRKDQPPKPKSFTTRKKHKSNKDSRSMQVRFLSPAAIPKQTSLQQQTQTPFYPPKNRHEPIKKETIKNEKYREKNTSSFENKNMRFVWQQPFDKVQQKENLMIPTEVTPKTMQTSIMSFQNRKEFSRFSDSTYHLSTQTEMSINENRQKRTDLMGL